MADLRRRLSSLTLQPTMNGALEEIRRLRGGAPVTLSCHAPFSFVHFCHNNTGRPRLIADARQGTPSNLLRL